MMIRLRIIATLILLIDCLAASTQNLSNKGTEFWVGYGHHQFFETGSNSQQMVIYLSAEQAANVTVSINGTSYSQTYSVPANSVISTTPMQKTGTNDCRLYSGAPGFTGTLSEGTSDRGIHIVSDVPIVAYAHIYGSQSSGATMLMPTDTWGYSYTSMNSKQAYSSNCFSWLYVVAKENNTKVQIIPSVPSRGGKVPGVPFEVVLNKGQIYQLLGAMVNGTEGYELTGTTVKSIANSNGECFPIAVFSGSSRTYNPASCGSGGGDNDIQQLFPLQAWGRRYLTAPTSSSDNIGINQTNSYKILVKDPSTVVKRNGVVLTGLINNTYYRYESADPDYITADKPIMVAQFMTGGQCSAGDLGDPEMFYISPIEQGIKRVGFYRNTKENIEYNFLTLIIPTNGLNSLTIDGSNSFDYSYDHPGVPGYTVVLKKWDAAQAQCVVQSDSAFTAITYGLGSVESYGYNAGTMINNLNVLGSIHNTLDPSVTSHAFTCPNTPAEISVWVAYKPTSMVWNLSQIPELSPNTDVTFNSPVAEDSMMQNNTKYYKYSLPGTYMFSDTGTFDIPVKNTNPSIDNCNNSEVVKFSITVKSAAGVANFTVEHTGCVLDSVHLNAGNTYNGFNVGNWAWTYPDNSTATGQHTVKLFTASGTRDVKLEVVTTEGCVVDTIETLTIFNKPAATFGTTPASICEGGNISFTDTSSYGGNAPINGWYWDFGNNNQLNASDNSAQSMTYPGYGTYTVKHVVKVSPTCISDTISKVITVYAKPILNISYPAGCLPTDGMVQFTNNTSTPDAQTLTHSWNFGDAGGSNASNPNTSTDLSPVHNFAVGTYTINYSVLSANGCNKDTSFNATFNLKPLLAYPALTSVCASVPGTVSIASATVTNNVPGSGYYTGSGVDASGNLTPSLAGEGQHTIWYIFNSSAGCRDSISNTVKILAKPTGNFDVTPGICLNQSATITDHSTISEGNIVSWNWNFGDNTSNNFNNSNPFNKSYSAWNTYTIKLVAVSDNNCVSDTFSKTIAVHPLPVSSFTLPTAICMPNGSASFVNSSSIADNSALSYQWDFGDASLASSSQNPSHVYTASGPYNVSLVTTSAFGCVKDSVQVLNAFYDKPVAAFDVSPDTLCQGTNNNFSNTSYAPNANVQSWSWEFGDGTISSEEYPVKKYNQPGNYTVTLTVKNDVGCISDAVTKNVIVYLQPVIDAGPSFVVPQGTVITFNPTANDSTVLDFIWTPSVDFGNPDALRPTLLATHNQTYTLTATGEGGCTATDTMSVKILKPVNVPNSFSPNGDGINDTWNIPNLSDYPGCTVEVYNRYGQIMYRSTGYGRPWDGSYKGSSLPFATYYYIINLKNGFAPITGSVTIVK